MIAPRDLPLGVNLMIFALAALAIWLAGVRVARHVDVLAQRTRLGQALAGLVLLATAASLPEIATGITAAALGNPELAMGDILGDFSMMIAFLAIADAWEGHDALTSFAPQPALLLEGVLLVLAMSVAAFGMVAGEPFPGAPVGIWPLILLGAYLLAVVLIHRFRGREGWAPRIRPADRARRAEEERKRMRRERVEARMNRVTLPRLSLHFAVSSAIILLAGVMLAATADAVAAQTGVASTFLGATFLALATSLPELTTAVAAVRIGANSLAISDAFGTNLLKGGVFVLLDLAYLQGAIFATTGRFAILATLLGITLTAIYLMGLVIRRTFAIGRLGVDSVAVLILYPLGLMLLYLAR